MSIAELYTKDARVWIPDPDMVWKSATLLEDYKGPGKLKVLYEDEEEEVLKVGSGEELPPLRNPEILIGENDLTSLSYLHEPAVLYNLQVRFCDRNDIYTYCGIVLVAINPYEQLPIYDNDTIQAYSGQDMASMDPHIFAVAEEAFKRMSRFDENQSIIVSGESGAGKTVSAKYAMRYFATVCGAEAETQIEKKVLASNPIMEAIGNAKTTRNDNSSRFGKYIEIGFSRNDTICGANMRTYLLEKSRVVFQASEERNYHIFYQLCASSEMPEYDHLHLSDADTYFYTNQGEAPIIDGVDDQEELTNTREAFTLLGINEHFQMEIFQVMSGILHMGNMIFQEDDNETCKIPRNDKHLPIMAGLLGIDEEQIRHWLCYRKMTTARETITKPLTITQAYFARDALSKHVYATVFDWIVGELNKALFGTEKIKKFIGVLDIYGFETFEINSFEQFCINYANEKLQQQFCLHVFKLEQEEYVREQIAWSFIDFYDNQPCIDLIEGKLGILDLLDEECKMPKGSDKNWCQKLYDKHLKHAHFEKPRMSNTAFLILHFADRVEYQMDGFLEKNRDTVLDEHINILKASQQEFVSDLFMEKAAPASATAGPAKGPKKGGVIRPAKEQAKPGSKSHRKTVGSQFRDSLNKLMETLFSTTPHYVRCIKPNDYKMPFGFEPKRAVQQLRACGVLETIRISAAGYPSRWTYAEFFQRYRVLAHSKEIKRNDMKKTCENILTKLIEDRDKYQFGKTKIFFRAGQVAYLEKLRSERLRACGILIQKMVRGWLARLQYRKIQTMVRLVQTRGRGMVARRHAVHLRRTHAATLIQSRWRGYCQRRQFLRLRSMAISIQSYARGLIGRQKFQQIKKDASAITVQKYIRSWLQRKRYHRMIRGFILLQSHFRRRKARKLLKQLKIEARSVEHVKKQAKGLENKIIELQQKLDEKNKALVLVREDQVKLHEMRNEVERLRQTDSAQKASLGQMEDMEELIARLRAELAKEKEQRSRAEEERDRIQAEKNTIISTLTEDKVTLKEKLDDANQLIKSLQEGKGEQKKADSDNMQLRKEIEAERAHHQKLVKDYARLQQRFENLQGDMQLLSPTSAMGPSHHRTPSGISNISLESESSDAASIQQQPLQPQVVRDTNSSDDQDQGYGSGRKAKDSREDMNNVDWTQQRSLDSLQAKPGDKVPLDRDLGLVSRLQTRVKELEKEKARLRKELDKREGLTGEGIGPEGEAEREIYDTIKLQELEMENAKVRQDLNKLRKAVSDSTDFEGTGIKGGSPAKEFMSQYEAMTDELGRRREECIQLRTLLATRSRSLGGLGGGPGQPHIADESYGGDNTLVNEDGELEMAYKTQKDLNKLLENELQRTQKTAVEKEKELQTQIDELKAETDKQQKLIGQNLTLTPEAKIEATMQHEITRLTSENLDLREAIDKKDEQIKKLKKALKIYAKRLKSTEASDVAAELEREMEVDEHMPSVKKYQAREYCGMLEYRKEDEPLLIRNLILDLKPRMSAQHLPGLPAYIMIMSIRHTDYMNDDEKVRSLLTSTINGIKKVVKKRQDDVESIALWLANTCRLLHNLKQYSGEKAFQSENTPKQNEHCLRNFDLSEYRQILSDLAVWIYQGLIKLMESQIHPMIVGAVLEHEAIAGLSAGKPTGLRGRILSKSGGDKNKTQDISLDALIRSLNNFMRVLTVHAVDPELVKQVFRQLFYFICANALNNLLLRKDMCHWSKGMQMRYNLSHLEQWIRDEKLTESGVQQALEPIIQASQLLQARKSVSDVESICDMCSRLSTSQIIKILNLYTPVNEFEERVPISFIRKIQECLSNRQQDGSSKQTLLMDTKFFYAVTFPFNPSSLGLETVQPPTEWGLGFLKRL